MAKTCFFHGGIIHFWFKPFEVQTLYTIQTLYTALTYVYIYIYIYMCVFYRLTRDVMQLKKPRNIKIKPNQTKQVKITKTTNINFCTNKHTLL